MASLAKECQAIGTEEEEETELEGECNKTEDEITLSSKGTSRRAGMQR